MSAAKPKSLRELIAYLDERPFFHYELPGTPGSPSWRCFSKFENGKLWSRCLTGPLAGQFQFAPIGCHVGGEPGLIFDETGFVFEKFGHPMRARYQVEHAAGDPHQWYVYGCRDSGDAAKQAVLLVCFCGQHAEIRGATNRTWNEAYLESIDGVFPYTTVPGEEITPTDHLNKIVDDLIERLGPNG